MAGNARGKLKEELEGIHRNYDWINVHCQKAKGIVGDTHPELHKFFNNIAEQAKVMDELLLHVYASV